MNRLRVFGQVDKCVLFFPISAPFVGGIYALSMGGEYAQ